LSEKICVVGLGYVGLPLAVLLSKKNDVTGFDVNSKKIEELKTGIDVMEELSKEKLLTASVKYTDDASRIKDASFIIVAVPTPVDSHNNPDMKYVTGAAEIIGKNLSRGTVIVYESTVYPGVTEEICVPVLEKNSGLKCGVDFKVGYSPERINPGDKEHTAAKITKVVSAMDSESLGRVSAVYGSVIENIFEAANIKTAEAAKVIENIQRDLNIALMNELSLIFNKLGINTKDVIDAATTKWNFHRYTPGLVGGHCIGVDPYYLTYKAQELGYNPRVILAGREINDSMAKKVAEKIVKTLNKQGKVITNSKVLILGLTFKENVRDARNSKTKDLIQELKEHGVNVLACDPHLTQEEIDYEGFGVTNSALDSVSKVDAIILTVPHKEFIDKDISFYSSVYSNKKLFFDIKGFFSREKFIKEGFDYLSL